MTKNLVNLLGLFHPCLPVIYGIMISHYKDTYKPTSIMECHKSFERCSGVVKRIQKTKRLFIFVKLRSFADFWASNPSRGFSSLPRPMTGNI